MTKGFRKKVTWGDMVEVYVMMHVVEKVDRETYISLSHNARIWEGAPNEVDWQSIQDRQK